ncbi:MAG: DNA modification methylase [Candidatus Promineifilaceae bacterium]
MNAGIKPQSDLNQTPDLNYIVESLRPLAIPIGDPTLDPSNAREGHDVDGIAASLRIYGQRTPIVINVDEGGRTLKGNGTLKAALSLGWTHIAAVCVTDDAATATGYAIADNKLGDSSRFNQETLAQLLEALPPDMPTGFGDQELTAILAEHRARSAENHDPNDAEPQTDEADTLRQKWGVETGQMWCLPSRTEGQAHFIICGSSTDKATVERLMQGERAALFATDPPYLVDYDGTNHPQSWGKKDNPQKNKDRTEDYTDWDASEQGVALYDGFVSVAIEVAIRPNAAWYCWHASRRQAMLEEVWERHGAFAHQQIIWAKSRPVLTRSWYLWQHEPCFFGWIRGNKPVRSAEDYPSTIWQIDSTLPGTATLHPTSKPLEVFETPMKQHTYMGEICYEPFSGSGSQLIAAENLARQCRAVELAPQFVAVALERYQEAFGITAELVD